MADIDPAQPESWKLFLETLLANGWTVEQLKVELAACDNVWERWIEGGRPPRELARRLLMRDFPPYPEK